MQNSDDYIKIDDLKNNYSYKIIGRNAYVGIWVENEKSFMISRYTGLKPYLFHEYHWDIGTPFGTVKPIELIELCPFSVKGKMGYNKIEEKKLLEYLDKLEEDNPIINGYNSLQERKSAAIKFIERLVAGRNSKKIPVHTYFEQDQD